MSPGPAIVIHPDVARALRDGAPVVALETAVLTHGLPRDEHDPGAGPLHLATARSMVEAVREGGAVPATVGVLAGRLHVGLEPDELERLAVAPDPAKASTSTLAAILAAGRDAGTTVAATLAACAATTPPLRVFATGGIGGVHPGFARLPDISADLTQLARTRTAVVCAGAKSILDLPATIEVLETLGVPVLGLETDHFPRFHARGTAALRTWKVGGVVAAAEVCRTHWEVLGQPGGVLVTNPIPEAFALDDIALDAAVADANAAADAARAVGAARTPFVLADLAKRTAGRTLVANVALLLHNARAAAGLAAELAGG
jgi:pseudouridine-5'-phosphate glycosidase